MMVMRKCLVCLKTLDTSCFRTTNNSANTFRRECRGCERVRVKREAKELKDKIVAHYGGRCDCCGENRREFLAIDHMHGGGARHRSSFGGAAAFYRWLGKHFPEGYRILCHNCNQSLGIYGYCPHQATGKPSIEFETTEGDMCIKTRINDGMTYESRLYLNCGQTPTLVFATHATKWGAKTWAEKILRDQVVKTV